MRRRRLSRSSNCADDWRKCESWPYIYLFPIQYVLTQRQIYCTVGNEEKIRYLEDNYAIDRSHIFNSRDSSFFPAVMRATNNRGVDVVLNSLAGDLLHASWKCVAEFGTMVEIGKRDFRRRTKLSMEAFEQNRSFIGIDMWQITQVQPETAAE